MKIQSYHDKIAMLSVSKITKLTGCWKPCQYSKYEIFRKIDSNVDTKGERSIELILATSHAVEQSEVLLYPAVSFVSEFGGALGLFLGFSFVMVLDAFEIVFTMFCNSVKTTQN